LQEKEGKKSMREAGESELQKKTGKRGTQPGIYLHFFDLILDGMDYKHPGAAGDVAVAAVAIAAVAVAAAATAATPLDQHKAQAQIT